MPVAKYVYTFMLDDNIECFNACVYVCDPADAGVRKIVSMEVGPFDSPEDILGLFIEMCDHAEWHGEQLTLPIPSE